MGSFALYKLKNKADVYQPADYELYQFNFPSEIIAYLLLRGYLTLVLESPTGLAKTSFIHTLGQSLCGENIMKLTNIVDLERIQDNTAWLAFDDIGGAQSDVKEFSQWVHIFSTEQNCRIRVLYKTIFLPKNLARVFTTNNFGDLLKPEHFPQDLKEAVFRRLCYVKLTESLINVNYEADKKILESTNKPIYRSNNEKLGTTVVLNSEILCSILGNFENATLQDLNDIRFIKEGLRRLSQSTAGFSSSFNVTPNECQVRLFDGMLAKIEESSQTLNH